MSKFQAFVDSISWKRLSPVVIALIFVFLVYRVFSYQVPVVYSWDLFGSYIYLPMLFDQHQLVFNDLSYFEAVNAQHQLTDTLYQFVQNENGTLMTKYTLGWSLLMLPFYLLAELWAWMGGYPTDGFSLPYKTMIIAGNLVYTLLSLVLLRRLLLKFFSEKLSLILILILVFGTNFLFTQSAMLGSTHLIEFFLVICLLLQTMRFYERLSLWNGALLGMILAFIFLVRPPDLVFALIPIFWVNRQFPHIFIKIRELILRHSGVLLVTLLAFSALVFLQLGYWKLTAGSWLVDSYANNSGEGFDWKHPYIWEVLFSFRKGWLLYTPIMIFALAGFFFWIRKDRSKWIFPLTFLLFFYIVSSWTTWWYASSFSQRAVIEAYPILLIAFGYFLVYLRDSRLKLIFYPLLSLLVLFNLFQTYQADKGIIHNHRMTKAYYFSVFGQISLPTVQQMKLLYFDNNRDFIFPDELERDFRESKTRLREFRPVFKLNAQTLYSPTMDLQVGHISDKEYFVIHATWSYDGDTAALRGKIFYGAVFHEEKPYGWLGKGIEDPKLVHNSREKTLCFTYISPHIRSKEDVIRFGAWSQSGEEIELKELKVEIYEPK
ncbi:MAG: hypothetical protein ACO1O6_15225 [Bacteroidota bacterium]